MPKSVYLLRRDLRDHDKEERSGHQSREGIERTIEETL